MKAAFTLSWREDEVDIKFKEGEIVASSFQELVEILKTITKGVKQCERKAKHQSKIGKQMLNTLEKGGMPIINHN